MGPGRGAGLRATGCTGDAAPWPQGLRTVSAWSARPGADAEVLAEPVFDRPHLLERALAGLGGRGAPELMPGENL